MRRAIGGQSARGMYRVQAVASTARGISVAAPVGGWNAIAPLSNMPPQFAVTLQNLFPQPGYLEIRKGHKTHNTLDPVDDPVETLMAYNALTSANDKLFAVAGTGIFDVTVATSTTITVAHGGLTNARLQHVNMSTSGGNYLWVCNGADKPIYYDGSVWTTTSITGITSTEVVNVEIYKERIWMVRTNTMSPAYLPADSIQGTASVFDLSGVFNKGGYLQAIASWTYDSNNGLNAYIAFITSRGEVALYLGSDPASDFTLRGVYEIGPPLGRRCLTKVGADVAVICADGVLPLTNAIQTDRASSITAAITANIQPAVNSAARDYGANFGWQLIGYPRGTRAILNVPVTENTLQEQYVMNTVTGAWTRFTGENANCWVVFRDKLYYGDNAGVVKEADCQGFDDDGAITFDVETAFNYGQARGVLKQFDMCRTLLTTDGQVSPGMTVNTDFNRDAVSDVPGVPVSSTELWDVAAWDQGVWPQISHVVTDWSVVSGIGYCFSIRMSASISASTTAAQSQSLTLQINGWDLLLKDGAFL